MPDKGILRRGLSVFLHGLFLTTQALADPFVAFNDYVPGLGTGTNVTSYGPGQSGALRDVTSGNLLAASLTVTMQGGAMGPYQGRPDYGTPASIVFDGFVDIAGYPNPALELAGPTNVVTYTFNGLNPDAEYNFQGTAIRGNINYAATYWSLCEITNADSFICRPTEGALTSNQLASLKPSQVLLDTGNNVQGDLAWWEHIRPGPDGSFRVISRQYSGSLPGGGSASGPKGFGLTAVRLEENPIYGGRTNPPPRYPGRSVGGINGISAVWMIVMENHDWSTIKGSTNCPYINNTVLPQATWCERYYNPPGIHPSLPNYLWLVSGTNYGIRDDSLPSINHRATTNTLGHLLDAAGLSWKCYAEDIAGTNCPDTAVAQYVPRHVPFVYFDSIRNDLNYCTNHIRPYGELASDLNSGRVAAFNFLVPNKTNDMHDLAAGSPSTRKQGDDWLARKLPTILSSSAYASGGLIIVVFDEGEGSTGDGPVGAIFLSPRLMATNRAIATYYDHSSLLRTLQDIYGLQPYLGGALWANDMSEIFQTVQVTSLTRDRSATHVTATNLIAGHTALLQFTTDVQAGPWVNVQTNLVAGPFETFDDLRPAVPSGGFYRVKERP